MSAVVEILGLCKTYGPIVAVNQMDLEVPAGALFGLLGPNGAGKSTTFGICCGWLRPSAGQVRVLGESSLALHRRRGRVAALPQDATFPRQISVRLQLTHFGRLAGLDGLRAAQEADRVLALVGLSEAARRRGGELSHGMLKRVGLAQTLIGTPEVIFLDEPTAGLDPASARQVKDIIASLAPQTTVVLSSHNLAEVQELCTHGAILDRGRVLVKGTLDDLTHKDAEVAIDVRPGVELPLAALGEHFGPTRVAVTDGRLRITFAGERDAAEVIGEALALLLAARVPILGVRRGQSLESAFLELTAAQE